MIADDDQQSGAQRPVLREPGPFPSRAEIVIVGAGVMGLSIAYQLCKRGLTNIVIVDRGYLAEGASGRNGGGVRQQWSTETNIRLMQESIALCKDFATELKVNVWFRQGGYLFLARNAAEAARLERNTALQNRLGIGTEMLDPQAALKIVPELNLEGVVGACYNGGDGILFPWPFLWGYAQKATAMGAKLFTHTPVLGLTRVSGGFTVATSRGEIFAKRVINACGAWSGQLSSMLGVSLPTFPIRHEICSSEPLKPFLGPMVSELASGLYFSQSMRGEIVGGVTLKHEKPTFSTQSQLAFLTTYAKRITSLMPILQKIKVLRQWAGLYDGSPDGNPILGEPENVPNFFLACGFVGHGFMMAPVIGKLYAQWLTGESKHPIFDMWTLARFARGDVLDKEDFNIG